MTITVIQGRISHAGQSTETHGAFTRGTGQINTFNAATFRIGNRAILFKSANSANIGDGDLVTVAGEESSGSFRAIAVRNDTTHAVYSSPAGLILICSGLLAVISLPLMFILIGFPLAAYALYCLSIGVKGMSANNLLAATPIPAG